MKKFLTVLLALSVVFTYSFSAVGTAFAAAPTDKDDFITAVQMLKASCNYKDGYYNDTGNPTNPWNGEVSQKVFEDAVDFWAGGVDLTSVDYVSYDSSNKVVGLSSDGNTALWKNVMPLAEKNQYYASLAEWDAAVAAVDLNAYTKNGREALEAIINAGETKIKAITTGAEKIEGVKIVNATIRDLKAGVIAQKGELLSTEDAKIAATIAELRDLLADKSTAFYAYAKNFLETYLATDANEVLAKTTFDEDFSALVAALEEVIIELEAEAREDGFTAVQDKIIQFKNNTAGYYFQEENPVSASGKFQSGKNILKQYNTWAAYYENEAVKAKAEQNSDGTQKYYSAEVDQLLKATKTALLEKDLQGSLLYAASFQNTAAKIEWDKLVNLADKNYDLMMYKNAAVEKFTTNDYKLDHWYGDRADKVKALQGEYKEKVLLAETAEAVDALVTEAKAAIDKIMTKNEVKAVADKAAARIVAAGHLNGCTIATGNDGYVGEVATATDTSDKGFGGYFGTVVGQVPTYDSSIKADALLNAAQTLVDAVLAEENDSITYKEIDAVIAANKSAALNALENVKTRTALNTEKAAVEALITALPSVVTISDKEQVLAAQAAMDSYVANAGAKQADVANYTTLKTALDKVINAEKTAVQRTITLLPVNVTLADADKIAAARAAFDAFEDTYADYIGSDFSTVTGGPTETKLVNAEAALEQAKLNHVADLIRHLTNDSTKAEIEAAKAAFDELTLDSKLQLKNLYYNKLMNAVNGLVAKDIAAVKAIKINATTKRYDGSKIKVNWTAKGDTAAIDGYRIYYSTKRTNTGYKYLAKTTKNYINHTSIKKTVKKGTRVFYKVRAYVEIDGQRYFSDYSNPANRLWK